ncbi:hypothetical protein Nepgr_021674 [Nepenthes gracilis]|uniref:Uncharacterized protein n=1 Tax=Nepenthes gracilis TaxID=150966 RepID=A0AAD3SX69_NEPGR|nr:hypothetical protein Nepgr_021674 [Nepenthes gracilis]
MEEEQPGGCSGFGLLHNEVEPWSFGFFGGCCYVQQPKMVQLALRNSSAGNPLSKIALPKCHSKPASSLVDLPSEVKCPALAEEVFAAAVSSPVLVNAAKDMTPAPVSLAVVSKPQHISSPLPLNSGSVVDGLVLTEVDVNMRPVSAPFSAGVENSPDSELGVGPLADDPADAPGSSFDVYVDPVEADTGPGDVKFDENSFSESSLQTPVPVPAVIPEVVYVMKPSCVDGDLPVSSHAHRASGPSAEIDPEFTPDSISRIVRKHCLIQSDPAGYITPTLEANRPACSDVDSAVTMPPNESGHDPALPIVYPDYGAEDPTALTRAFSAAFKYHLLVRTSANNFGCFVLVWNIGPWRLFSLGCYTSSIRTLLNLEAWEDSKGFSKHSLTQLTAVGKPRKQH